MRINIFYKHIKTNKKKHTTKTIKNKLIRIVQFKLLRANSEFSNFWIIKIIKWFQFVRYFQLKLIKLIILQTCTLFNITKQNEYWIMCNDSIQTYDNTHTHRLLNFLMMIYYWQDGCGYRRRLKNFLRWIESIHSW